jgi:hypothetical protein
MKGIETAGAERYLPALEDRRVQRVEQKLARVDAWTEQLRVSVLVCISEASEARESVLLHVPAPSPEPVAEVLAHLSFEVHREVGLVRRSCNSSSIPLKASSNQLSMPGGSSPVWGPARSGRP